MNDEFRNLVWFINDQIEKLHEIEQYISVTTNKNLKNAMKEYVDVMSQYLLNNEIDSIKNCVKTLD